MVPDDLRLSTQQASLLEELAPDLPLACFQDLEARVRGAREAAAALRAAEHALAVDLALARAGYDVGAGQLAQITGLSRRTIGRLIREAHRSAW